MVSSSKPSAPVHDEGRRPHVQTTPQQVRQGHGVVQYREDEAARGERPHRLHHDQQLPPVVPVGEHTGGQADEQRHDKLHAADPVTVSTISG